MPIPVLVTAPTVEPITLGEAKAHLRVDGSDDDTLISSLIAAARRHVEDLTGRALITQSWQLSWDDRFPDDFRLPKGRLQAVDGITYVDGSGATITLDQAAYVVDAESEPGRVTPAWGASWPATRCQPVAVTVDWTCGYGDAAGDVPAPIRAAMLLLIGTLYRDRETVNIGNVVNDLPTFGLLLSPYRLWSFG
ncbi:hypothetical protein A6A04_13445 [Paramagnetospirillum marisnigri]|uniref:PhiE125 gp8 family phage protein n=1 Tax=Paramagnetospirillum marisnigri TaxID=1285242 RepID=A0A178MV73_9PROT|nr:head-tail connector protein [Paramagnetospirillum marisnigri]OAN53891.1 hypothetical protein A6A04_13445 [Paramagnetospirillum marisnigri]